MIKGRISSIESLGTVDGPGIRYVVFMQGCSLRCLYCHNPETWLENEGSQCLSPQELIKKIINFKPYFGEEGGVTFSGGEPLLQPQFLIETLKLCKKNGIHTCLDTAGVGRGDYEKILPLVDLVILDVKACDDEEYKKITGRDMTEFYNFLSACQKFNTKLWIRQVILPKFNDDEKHIEKLANFLKGIKNVEKVELLPYKKIGKHKYEILNIPYRLSDTEEMNEEKCKELEKELLSILT